MIEEGNPNSPKNTLIYFFTTLLKQTLNIVKTPQITLQTQDYLHYTF